MGCPTKDPERWQQYWRTQRSKAKALAAELRSDGAATTRHVKWAWPPHRLLCHVTLWCAHLTSVNSLSMMTFCTTARVTMMTGWHDNDKLHKVRPLVNGLNWTVLEAYEPSKLLSVDESMNPFKGRSTRKKYMPMRPVKRVYSMMLSALKNKLHLEVSNINREVVHLTERCWLHPWRARRPEPHHCSMSDTVCCCFRQLLNDAAPDGNALPWGD